MNQKERRRFLIEELLEENRTYAKMKIPEREEDQRRLLRSLMNIRMPGRADSEFLRVQDAYLLEENARKGVVTLAELKEVQPDLLSGREISQGFRWAQL